MRSKRVASVEIDGLRNILMLMQLALISYLVFTFFLSLFFVFFRVVFCFFLFPTDPLPAGYPSLAILVPITLSQPLS